MFDDLRLLLGDRSGRWALLAFALFAVLVVLVLAQSSTRKDEGRPSPLPQTADEACGGIADAATKQECLDLWADRMASAYE